MRKELAEIRGQAGGQRRKLELQREADLCAARRETDAEKKRLRAEMDDDLAREVRRMKEVVGQEYEYRLAQLEDGYKRKSQELEARVGQEKREFSEQKELEYTDLVDAHREQVQQERVRTHAQTTQDLYDDIHKSLKDKFQLEQKARLAEITTKLKKSFESKIAELENSKEKDLALERKKIAKIELKNAQ